MEAIRQMISRLEALCDELEDLLDDTQDGPGRVSLTDALDYVEDAMSSLEDIAD